MKKGSKMEMAEIAIWDLASLGRNEVEWRKKAARKRTQIYLLLVSKSVPTRSEYLSALWNKDARP
jgi:hypothetical protein